MAISGRAVEDAAREASRTSSWIIFLPWIVCAISLLIQFQPMIFSGLEKMHGGLGDGRLVNFILEHGYRWLLQIPPHQDFWQPPIFYPFTAASAFTDTMLGFGLPYWLSRLLGAGPHTAMQWWLFSIYVLNFSAVYFLLRNGLKVGVAGSTAAALVSAVGALSWFGHPQLCPIFYMALALLALFRIFDQGESAPSDFFRKLWIVVFAACFVLQVWSAVYAFFYFSLLVLVGLSVALVRTNVRAALIMHIKQDLTVWLVAGSLSLAAVMPLVHKYEETAEASGYRKYNPATIAQPLEWVLTQPDSLLFKDLYGSIRSESRERLHGAGFLSLVVTIIGLLTFRRYVSVQLLSISTLTVIALGTMYWGGFSPWEFIHKYFPGAGGIRAQYRITMILMPVTSIGIAFACQGLADRNRWWLAVFLAVFCAAEHFRTPGVIDKSYIQHHIASIAAKVDPSFKAFFLAPGNEEFRWVAEDAAWVAMSTGVPTVNGRYGNLPVGYELRFHMGSARKSVRNLSSEDAKSEMEKALRNWLNRNEIRREDVQWIEYEALNDKAVRPFR